jgi:hypothetical protein
MSATSNPFTHLLSISIHDHPLCHSHTPSGVYITNTESEYTMSKMQSDTTSGENQVRMKSNQYVPSPRPLSTSTSISVSTSLSSSRPARRLSLNIPNPTYGHGRSHPIPVPAPGPVPTRHGSISYSQSQRYHHRASISTSFGTSADRRVGSSLSLSLGRGGEIGGYGVSKRMEDDEWLRIGICDIVSDEGGVVSVDGEEGMEKAVEVSLTLFSMLDDGLRRC